MNPEAWDFVFVHQAIDGLMASFAYLHHPDFLRLPNGRVVRWRTHEEDS